MYRKILEEEKAASKITIIEFTINLKYETKSLKFHFLGFFGFLFCGRKIILDVCGKYLNIL